MSKDMVFSLLEKDLNPGSSTRPRTGIHSQHGRSRAAIPLTY